MRRTLGLGLALGLAFLPLVLVLALLKHAARGLAAFAELAGDLLITIVAKVEGST